MVIEGNTIYGKIYYTAIGALNVGNIIINFENWIKTNQLLKSKYKNSYFNYQNKHIKIGEEIGYFSLGSTISLLIELP